MIPFAYFGLVPSEHLPNQLKDLAKFFKKFYPTMDDSIYNFNRKFRVPFSRHEKGNHKVVMLPEWSMEDALEYSSGRDGKYDFLNDIEFDVDPSPVLVDALQQSQRESYEIEKERAGTIDKPSPFESYDNKLCIVKMLDGVCDDIGRNNACMRIVNDYYRTGKSQNKCEKDVYAWANDNGLPMAEVSTIISNIYERGGNYNFGCQDECKSVYCSAKCSIWKKLAPDKRPITVDMPNSALVEANAAKQPKEFDVVEKVLMETFGCGWDDRYKKFKEGTVCKQGAKDLFIYKEGYWQHLNHEQTDLIKIKFNALYENILTTRRIEGIFKMFMMYVPSKPNDIDMFIPNPMAANFNNGTLHLTTDSKGEYSFDFRDHDKLDFITFKVDFDYDANQTQHNVKFDEWLLEYLSGDKEQFDLVQEMFGASLVPTFPQLFMLLGLSGTGKSTCMKVLRLMHGDCAENMSGVPPHNFNGFHTESMVGKLVNMVMDIKTNCKIDDDAVKQIEDRVPVRVQRKNKEDLYAPLPALHIFGANSMPQTLEGYSGAMSRRWSIINFDKVFKGKKNRNIHHALFNHNPQGVINFAVEGLMRLACGNQGFFSRCSKSVESVSEWTASDDMIQMFLNDGIEDGFGEGELTKIEVSTGNRINKTKLWNLFNDWQEQGLARNEQIGRNSFYKMMKVKGFPTKRFEDSTYICGLGESNPSSNSSNSI